MEARLWWGYKHINGNYQAKPYTAEWGPMELDDAYESPFCDVVLGPIVAKDRDDALKIIKRMTDEISRIRKGL